MEVRHSQPVGADAQPPSKHRKRMQAVKPTDTSVELRLRHALWSRGHRYRKNAVSIPGKPDIVFPSLRVAIFCDSEFWHGHDWERRKLDFKSNQEFWFHKIESTMARDRAITAQLEADGWKVIRLWGRDINKRLDECVQWIESVMEEQRRSKHG